MSKELEEALKEIELESVFIPLESTCPFCGDKIPGFRALILKDGAVMPIGWACKCFKEERNDN